MESVMILGAGPLQVPAIKKAKEMGLHVIVCDYNPDAEGFGLADEKYVISTLDQEAVLEKARELKPDFVLTSASDAPVRTAAYVCEQLGLPIDITYENACCATIKSKMRERLKEYNVPIPQFFVCESYDEFKVALDKFEEECIIKPVDNAASRGVLQVKTNVSEEELKQQYQYCKEYSRSGSIIVEELMKGPEVSVECFVVDSVVDIIAVTDKKVTSLPYFVELGHSQQSMLPEKTIDEIKLITKQAIKAIGIVNGISHTEIKVTADGPKIVEVAARLGGDHITSDLVPLSTGVDMVGNSLALALRKPIDLSRTKQQGSAIRYITAPKGKIKSINIDESVYKLSGVEEICLMASVGEVVNEITNSNDRLGYVITTGIDAQEAITNAERALGYISIKTEINDM